MKDTKYLSFRPIYHFTDAYIRVHALYCVIALILAALLNKEVEALGEKISVHRMLDKFQDAQQVITVYPGTGKKKVIKFSFSRLDGIVKDYVEKYNLKKYADKL
jgi:transposase